MLCALDPKNDLETLRGAVAALLARAEECGISPGDHPWSLAELRPGAEDYLWLQAWAQGLDCSLLYACTNHPWHQLKCRGRRVTLDAAMGLLLLLFAVESGRREATEGTLWPHIRSDEAGRLRFGVEADAILFQNGPSTEYKAWLAAAVRTFSLRHVLDTPDVQRYYRTVFLQFGFPIRDARKRLAHWLVGGVAQVACHHLLNPGDRRCSKDFCFLWESLRGYRRNNLGPKTMLQRLRESAWVLPEWAEELLDLARMEVAGGESNSSGASPEEIPFLSEPRLCWRASELPVLVVRVINLTDLGLCDSEYEVRLAGEIRARIFRTEEDRFEVEPREDLELPLSGQTVSAELVDEEGRIARAEPIACWDPAAPATFFRLP